MKSAVLLLFCVLLFSCKSIKIKEEITDTISLIDKLTIKGKVEKVYVNMEIHPFSPGKERKPYYQNTTVFYDESNKIIKKIDEGDTSGDGIWHTYKNGLLESILLKYKSTSNLLTYQYDNKKNIVDYQYFSNNILDYRKTTVYDSQNNPLEETNYNSYPKKNNGKVKYIYNYKKLTGVSQSHDTDNQPVESKFEFNKKGQITSRSSIYDGQETKTDYEYDKFGNISKVIGYYPDGKTNTTTCYTNSYDKKGNMIAREVVWNDILLEKTTFKITYRD